MSPIKGGPNLKKKKKKKKLALCCFPLVEKKRELKNFLPLKGLIS